MNATQPGTDVAVTYYIVDGNTTIFKIGLCNGQIRINNPYLDYHAQPVHTLVVQARSNALLTSATNATIIINVLNVPHPPVFNATSCTLSVNESMPAGTRIPPAIGVYDIDRRAVTVYVDTSSPGSDKVLMDASTQLLYTLYPFDYEAPLRQVGRKRSVCVHEST